MRCYLKLILVLLILQLFFTYTFTISSDKKLTHSQNNKNEKSKNIAKGNRALAINVQTKVLNSLLSLGDVPNKITPKSKLASLAQLTTTAKAKDPLAKKNIKSNIVKRKPGLLANRPKVQQPSATSTKKMQSWYEVQIFDNEKNKKPELEMLPQDEELLTVPRSNPAKPK
jgi:hypothetical protein